MISESIGAFLEILVFTFIPFVVYRIKNKTSKGFWNYIGLKKATKKANYLALLACFIFAAPMLILPLFNAEFKELLFNPNSVTGQFRQMGFGAQTVGILLITALFKTALAEEILFRGFIAKQLIGALGFKKGNLLQAMLFGGIHTLMFAFITSNLFFLLVIFIVPSIGAYVSGYLNEKVGKGSIIPGWISHGLANVLSYSIIGFIF